MTLTSAPTARPRVGGVAARMAAVVTPFFAGELPVRLRAWDGSAAGPADARVWRHNLGGVPAVRDF